MKSMYKSIFLLFSFFIFSKALIAQCATVWGEAVPVNPQTGPYNYFGVRVSMGSTYNMDVVVSGYIHPDPDPVTNLVPFELTITVGNTSAETSSTYYQTDPTGSAGVTITSVSPCPPGFSTSYNGATVNFKVEDNIRTFKSVNDFNTVFDQMSYITGPLWRRRIGNQF